LFDTSTHTCQLIRRHRSGNSRVTAHLQLIFG
jgi:hypothetical protein